MINPSRQKLERLDSAEHIFKKKYVGQVQIIDANLGPAGASSGLRHAMACEGDDDYNVYLQQA